MEISEQQANGATVLQLSGRLDGTTSAATDTKLADAVGRNPTLSSICRGSVISAAPGCACC